MQESFIRQKKVEYVSKGLHSNRGESPVWDRQSLIDGWDQQKLQKLCVLLIGAGGNSLAAWMLVRMGFNVHIVDYDEVELTNLPRQFYYHSDIGTNKAIALARNLVKEATCNSRIVGWAMSFQELVEDYPEILKDVDVGICFVDDKDTRYDVAECFFRLQKPVFFSAISESTTYGYVFYQDPGKDKPCFGCAFPPQAELKIDDTRCRSPSVIYIHLNVLSVIVFAISETLVRNRKLKWHLMNLWLDNGVSQACNPPLRSGCHVCGNLRGDEK